MERMLILNLSISLIIIVPNILRVIDIFMHILILLLIMKIYGLWDHLTIQIDICQKIMLFVNWQDILVLRFLCPWMKLGHIGTYVFDGTMADLGRVDTSNAWAHKNMQQAQQVRNERKTEVENAKRFMKSKIYKNKVNLERNEEKATKKIDK